MTRTDRIRFAHSEAELLADGATREPWKNSDSLSGSTLERVVIDQEPFVLKRVVVDDDWIMRATGDLHCRQLTLHASNLLDRLPSDIDDALVGVAPFMSLRGHRGGALLLRDISTALVPSGGDQVPLEVHRGFLTSMARMHAAYWGFADTIGLMPLAHHFVFLSPQMSDLERGGSDPVPAAVGDGWRRLAAEHPNEATPLRRLSADPWPLVMVLRSGPQTLIHGDWKFGNLGRHADGRTVLLDWDRSGEAPPLLDVAWYLAVNCDRLPETKEATIDAYRVALEAAGVATEPWWDAALAAALVGGFLMLCWAKLDDAAEFAWWSDHLDAWLSAPR